jgi:hypothetical protein
VVSPHSLKPCSAPQSLRVSPTCEPRPSRGLLRMPRHGYDRPLRGAEFRTAGVADGSIKVARFADLSGKKQPHHSTYANAKPRRFGSRRLIGRLCQKRVGRELTVSRIGGRETLEYDGRIPLECCVESATFWNMNSRPDRINAHFVHRPVTPGVAGSSPVHSAKILNENSRLRVAVFISGSETLEYARRGDACFGSEIKGLAS